MGTHSMTSSPPTISATYLICDDRKSVPGHEAPNSSAIWRCWLIDNEVLQAIHLGLTKTSDRSGLYLRWRTTMNLYNPHNGQIAISWTSFLSDFLCTRVKKSCDRKPVNVKARLKGVHIMSKNFWAISETTGNTAFEYYSTIVDNASRHPFIESGSDFTVLPLLSSLSYLEFF